MNNFNFFGKFKEFIFYLNKKLNTFVGAKVNEITSSEYNMYYNKIPETYEPIPYNH